MASLTPGGNFLELLYRGLVTTAFLKVEGTVDSTNDMFTSLVITGARVSKHCLRRCVGKGSSLQDLDGAFKIFFLTSSSVAGDTTCKCSPSNSCSLIKNPLFPTFG